MAQSITNLAVGSKVKLGVYQVGSSSTEPIIWLIADKNNSAYPAGAITLITEKIIDLRGFDAKEPSNSDSGRKNYGNSRYRDSNLRQWLNKSGSPWWVATHTADATPNNTGMSEPTGYDGIPGFLSNFTDSEIDGMLDTTLTVARNTVTDSGGSETVVDKIFLPSNTEVGLANENSIVEGSKYALFTNNASRVAHLTQQALSNTASGSKPSNTSSGWYWWLRTPGASHSYIVRNVNTGGTLNDHDAYSGNMGVRPALNLKSDALVSDAADESGAYALIWTNVISDDLQKVSTTGFTWTVGTIGTHTGVKSQLHIYNSSGTLVSQGAIQNGTGTKQDTIIPTAAGNYTAKVKLWSNVTAENWSNEIAYTVTVIPYTLTLDKAINISAGEKLDRYKFDAYANDELLDFRSMDSEKIVYAGPVEGNTVELKIEGKDAKIDNIAYVVD